MKKEIRETTTIQLTVETKDRLAKLGLKSDTYDTILSRLLDKLGKKAIKAGK